MFNTMLYLPLIECLLFIIAHTCATSDAIVWKRLWRSTVFIFFLNLAAIGSAIGDCLLCASSGSNPHIYESPPCTNLDVFTRDVNIMLCVLFFFAVLVYISPRRRQGKEDEVG